MKPFWRRDAGGAGAGRHARQAPPAPQPAPAPRAPVGLGAGAYLRDGAGPDAGPSFTGLHEGPGGHLAAVIHLGGGVDVDVTRTLWLDDLAAAARDAKDALTRHAREAARAAEAGTRPPRPPLAAPVEGRRM
jgi:hypothetical protein